MAEPNTRVARHTHVPGPLPLRNVRCPFRQPARRKQFEGVVNDFRLRNSALFHWPESENHSNNIGDAFWRGYHGGRYIWDKEAPLWVAFRAGEIIAAATAAADKDSLKEGPRAVAGEAS